MTAFTLTDDEWELVSRVPVPDLVELAATLDIVVPARLDRRELVEMCVPRMVAVARTEGLPLSKYDRPDLESLTQAQLEVLGGLQRLRWRPSVGRILKAGQKVYKDRSKALKGGNDPYAYMVPILLKPLIRCASEGSSSDT